MSLLTTMKGLPLAYNKDMQEDKELSFDAMDTASACIRLFTGMLSTTTFNKERMADSCRGGFTNATDLADYLVGKGVPFRDAHGIVGRVVIECSERGIAIDDLKLDELKKYSELIDADVFEAIDLKNCVDRRNTDGAPGREAMERLLQKYYKDFTN